jgi:selenocysteine-specific elongation factor
MAGDLTKGGHAIPLGDRSPWLVSRDGYERLRRSVLSILEEHHRLNPLMMGLSREELREKVLPGGATEVARLVLERMAAAGEIRLEREFAAAASHRVALGRDEEKVLEAVEAAFREGGLSPAALADIVRDRRLDAGTAQRIYHLLLSRGRLIRIKDGTVFHAEALEKLKDALWSLRGTRPVIDVAFFKELTGTSRKTAIPLLEHLDAERVTRRRGNDREILPPPGAATS